MRSWIIIQRTFKASLEDRCNRKIFRFGITLIEKSRNESSSGIISNRNRLDHQKEQKDLPSLIDFWFQIGRPTVTSGQMIYQQTVASSRQGCTSCFIKESQSFRIFYSSRWRNSLGTIQSRETSWTSWRPGSSSP